MANDRKPAKSPAARRPRAGAGKPPGRPRDKALALRRSEEILDAAVQLFAEHGYRQADVQVLADQLGVGKGTVYRYFASKEKLFLAAVDRSMQRARDEIEAAVGQQGDCLDQMSTAVRTYLAYFDSHPEVVELLIQERAEFKDRQKSTYFVYEEAGRKERRQRLKQLMADGRMRRMPVDPVIDVVNNLLYGAMFTNYFAGRRKPFEQQAEEIVDIVFHGILQDKPTTPRPRKRRKTD